MNWNMFGKGIVSTLLTCIVSLAIRVWFYAPIDIVFVSMLIGTFFGGLAVTICLSLE